MRSSTAATRCGAAANRTLNPATPAPANWLNWREADTGMLEFTRRLLEFRRDHPALRPFDFFTGRKGDGEALLLGG